jgi:N-methylhydantoinase B
MTMTDEIVWDGKVHSYRPSADWKTHIAPAVVFYEDEVSDVDPVTYEVIRHRLWTINAAHGEMLKRISGSPVFQALDFNMCILTQDGEVVMNAPYIQFLNSGAPLAVPYILEHLGDDPGIAEGDIFVCNDPWIGAVHQMDVFYGMPVFVDGALFAWVSNAGHQYDLGGVSAGGWPEKAVDVYHDPVVMPPFKLVERGHLRPDLEALYLRHSRFPGLLALDLRAQIAGCRFAAEQIRLACNEFGAATVKGAMQRVLSAGQESFRQKLLRIPDGRWTDVMYFDEKLPGDRHTQRVQLNFEKVGDRLRVDNRGTQRQEEGPNGLTYAAFTGSVLGALTITMMQEHLFALGGAARQVDFDPEPGLLSCVDHPAAVSGGVLNVIAMTQRAQALVTRMLACDPAQARNTVMPSTENGLVVVSGVNDRGRGFGSALVEQVGSYGASSTADGVDHGGFPFTPLSRYPNVEETESFYPLVILWREQLADSAGAGRWRGGGGLHFGAMEYRSSLLILSTNTGAMAISGYGCPGTMGAYPVPTIQYQLARNTDVYEVFKHHRVPRSLADLSATTIEKLRGKSSDQVLPRGDVFAVRYPGGGGYGDPLLREPERVAEDVQAGWVTTESAAGVYGVVIGADRGPDVAATESLRARIRAERSEWARPREAAADATEWPRSEATGEPPRPVHACINSLDRNGERILACERCGYGITGYRGNYKLGLLLAESPVTEIPLVDDPGYYLDDPLVLRRYCCPECQVLMASEVVKVGEPHIPDMILFS